MAKHRTKGGPTPKTKDSEEVPPIDETQNQNENENESEIEQSDDDVSIPEPTVDIPDENKTLTEFLQMMDYSAIDSLAIKKFEYQGFDPDRIYESIIDRKKTVNISDSEFQSDIFTLVSIVLMRGTNIDKIEKKSSPEAAEKFKILKKRYKIIKSKPSGLGNTDLTLSRLLAVFPTVAYHVLNRGKLDPKLPKKGLPRGLHFTGGAALIEPTNLDLFELFVQWSIDFDKLINQDEHDPDAVREYSKIANQSKIVPPGQRAQFFNNVY